MPPKLEVAERTDVHHMFTGNGLSWGLKITNSDDQAIAIQRGILVEELVSSQWKQVAGIQAVDRCETFDYRYRRAAAISVAPHTMLDIVPWDGFLCGGQCTTSCLQNARAKPGIYRFAVVIVPTGNRIVSSPFTIPKPSLQ